MSRAEYIISPVLMGGLVKEVTEDMVKVHLHGRLGVITVPKSCVLSGEPDISGSAELSVGTEMQFYFSYFQINEVSYDYDSSAIKNGIFEPCLVGGTLTEVNDTAVKAGIVEGLGTAAVPRRWVFTDTELKEGQSVEFYLSPMKITGKRDIPVEFI